MKHEERSDFENELMRAESDAKARKAEDRKRDSVESAGRKAGRPEGPQGCCAPSREAHVGAAAGVRWTEIYDLVRRVLNDRKVLSMTTQEIASAVSSAFPADSFLTREDVNREVRNVIGTVDPRYDNHTVAAYVADNIRTLRYQKAAEAADRGVQVSMGPLQASPGAGVRSFSTGATRSSSEGKPDYEGYLSPLVIRRYGQFMLKHQVQPDGTRRPSDNWQKGIPQKEYAKSLWRHFMDFWLVHRGWNVEKTDDVEETLCAIIFNASGYLHEYLRGHRP